MGNQTSQNFEIDVYISERNRSRSLHYELEAALSRIQILADEINGGGSHHSGLSDEQIQKLPSTEINKQQMEDEANCSVCLMNYKKGDNVSKLPCNHFYHTGCIKQ